MTTQRRKKYREQICTIFAVAFLAAIFFAAALMFHQFKAAYSKKAADASESETALTHSEEETDTEKQEEDDAAERQRQNILLQAERMSAAYDYDEAIRLIRTIAGCQTDEACQEKIRLYQAQKASCVPVNLEEVTHVFYHSLVVDPIRAFAGQERDPQAAGNNQWMTTVGEFEKIIQEMYDFVNRSIL